MWDKKNYNFFFLLTLNICIIIKTRKYSRRESELVRETKSPQKTWPLYYEYFPLYYSMPCRLWIGEWESTIVDICHHFHYTHSENKKFIPRRTNSKKKYFTHQKKARRRRDNKKHVKCVCLWCNCLLEIYRHERELTNKCKFFPPLNQSLSLSQLTTIDFHFD